MDKSILPPMGKKAKSLTEYIFGPKKKKKAKKGTGSAAGSMSDDATKRVKSRKKKLEDAMKY